VSDIKDRALSSAGREKIDWAGSFMPVLAKVRERFQKERPLHGIRIGACLHITTETANLAIAIKAGGGDISLCASNPLSTKDDVAASLVVDFEIPVYAVEGEDRDSYYRHIFQVLDTKPHITIDDGADLVSTVHTQRTELVPDIIGGTEETTTGVIRLRALARSGELAYPIIAVNDSQTKYLFDNRYGTGQSTIDGVLRATNLLLAGTVVVVAGYGWCGRGIAMRAGGMGAEVIVTETNPVRALEARMDGYRVMSMMEAAKIGELFVTATGDVGVIRPEHIDAMRDGAILCNAGHFDVEIDKSAFAGRPVKRRRLRETVEEFEFTDGRRIRLLSEGRLVNLSCAEGHPPSVMDMSFANQALASEYLVKKRGELERKVYSIPEEMDIEIARMKLDTLGISIDELTEEQKKYLSSWEVGT
jgi:adenosylhomocysteinase